MENHEILFAKSSAFCRSPLLSTSFFLRGNFSNTFGITLLQGLCALIYRHTLFESQRLGIAFVAMEFLVMKMPTKM